MTALKAQQQPHAKSLPTVSPPSSPLPTAIAANAPSTTPTIANIANIAMTKPASPVNTHHAVKATLATRLPSAPAGFPCKRKAQSQDLDQPASVAAGGFSLHAQTAPPVSPTDATTSEPVVSQSPTSALQCTNKRRRYHRRGSKCQSMMVATAVTSIRQTIVEYSTEYHRQRQHGEGPQGHHGTTNNSHCSSGGLHNTDHGFEQNQNHQHRRASLLAHHQQPPSSPKLSHLVDEALEVSTAAPAAPGMADPRVPSTASDSTQAAPTATRSGDSLMVRP